MEKWLQLVGSCSLGPVAMARCCRSHCWGGEGSAVRRDLASCLGSVCVVILFIPNFIHGMRCNCTEYGLVRVH